MKKILLSLVFVLFGLCSFGQKITADELASRNEQLEYLLLDYKEQLIRANEKITQLTRENRELKRKINLLLMTQRKTDADIELLKRERKTLLLNNEILKETIAKSKRTKAVLRSQSQKLTLDNQLLTNANALLEDAAVAADTIQKYQELRIDNQRDVIERMALNMANQCVRLTGTYKIPFSSKQLTVVLGEGSFTNPNEIQNMTIKACYQTQGEVTTERIIVYFQIYDHHKKEVVRDIPFPLNRISSVDNIHSFEGEFTIPTDKGLKLGEEEYFYEIRYLEKVIAKGQL